MRTVNNGDRTTCHQFAPLSIRQPVRDGDRHTQEIPIKSIQLTHKIVHNTPQGLPINRFPGLTSSLSHVPPNILPFQKNHKVPSLKRIGFTGLWRLWYQVFLFHQSLFSFCESTGCHLWSAFGSRDCLIRVNYLPYPTNHHPPPAKSTGCHFWCALDLRDYLFLLRSYLPLSITHEFPGTNGNMPLKTSTHALKINEETPILLQYVVR